MPNRCRSRGFRWPLAALLLVPAFLLAASASSGQVSSAPVHLGSEKDIGRSYCQSAGGSTLHESISDVTYEVLGDGDRIAFVVDIFLANVSGCESGQECEEYDGSPEYVNAWVDWNGDEEWMPCERVMDKALTGYERINYLGILTARSEVQLPLNRVSEPMMRVNLGWGLDPNDPCLPSWDRGDVHDMPVVIKEWAITRLTATNGDGIREVPGNVIWDFIFDAEGNLIPVIDNYMDYPFSRRRLRTANLQTQISSWPAGGAPPTVTCRWVVTPTSHFGIGMGSFAPEAEGWTVNTPIRTPSRIGIYDVRLGFRIRSPDSQITNTTVQRKLFVPFRNPIPAEFDDGVGLDNKREWYDMACTWAAGTRRGWSALRRIRSREYDYGSGLWIYGYHMDEHNFFRTCDWFHLVDDVSCQTCPWPGCFSDCYDYTSALHNLCKVIGVDGFTEVTVRGAVRGFVTHPDVPSLDPMFPGNVKPEDGEYDRYQFKEHRLLQRGRRLHDPTFDARYGDPSEFILWDLAGNTDSNSWPTIQGPVLQRINPCFYDHWFCWDFEEPPPILAQGPEESSVAMTGNLLLDDIVSIYEVDEDNNGIAEGLAADVSMTILADGDYHVAGILTESGHVVSIGPRRDIQIMTGYGFAGEAGVDTARLQFSGEDIYEYGVDADYRLHFYASDSLGVSDSLSGNHTISHLGFGEVAARITSVSDGLVTAMQGADSLRLTIDVSARAPGTFGVEAELFADDTVSIATAWKAASLVVGTQQVLLDFSGEDINESELDGPYDAGIALVDSTGMMISSREHTTNSYNYTDFGEPLLTPTGTHVDSPFVGPEGGYEILDWDVELESQGAIGSSHFIGYVTEPDSGYTISVAEDTIDIEAGTHIYSLQFDGTDFGQSGVDGPYTLAAIEVLDDNLDLIGYLELGYASAPYQAEDFETGLGEITYLGDFTESLVDIDEDGFADFLDVAIGLETEGDAYLMASADLYDSGGRFIVNGTGELILSGRESGYLPIRFDGHYIFGNLRNGPFEVREVYIYHIEDIFNGIYIESIGHTQHYDNEDFEPAGVIAGIVESGPHIPAVGAEVRSYEFIDYTDDSGEYQLIYLADTTTTVRVIYEGISEWTTVLNGEYIQQGDSLSIDVVVGEVNELLFLKIDPSDVPEDLDLRGDLREGLRQNLPNPFTPSTQIVYVIPSSGGVVPVTLRVYDPAGRLVRTLVDESQRPGIHKILWDGQNDAGKSVNAGVYFYRLQWDGKTETRRMILVK